MSVKRVGIEIDVDLKKDFKDRLKRLGKVSMREATEALWFYMIGLEGAEVQALVKKYRKENVDRDQIIVRDVPLELHLKFKMACHQDRVSMNAQMIEVMRRHISGRPRPGPAGEPRLAGWRKRD